MAGICNLLCIIVIITVFTIITAKDYCTMQTYACKEKGSHTMCKYSSKPAAACGNSYKIGLSSAEKKAILDKHNECRQFVAAGKEKRGNPGPQPAAVTMRKLIWNDELAQICERWVIQCIWGHDKCRDVDRFVVGQNMGQINYWGDKNTGKVEDIVLNWYNEVSKFNNSDVTKYKFYPETGHYTQVVWADTTEVGCAQIIYKDSNWTKRTLCCNYGPSGNWIGQKIYEIKK